MDKDFAAGVTLTNQAILDQFAALPLTTRMRAAAGVLTEATKEHRRRYPKSAWVAKNWKAFDLIKQAAAMDADDKTRDAEVEELAALLRASEGEDWSALPAEAQAFWRQCARRVLDAGWAKS